MTVPEEKQEWYNDYKDLLWEQVLITPEDTIEPEHLWDDFTPQEAVDYICEKYGLDKAEDIDGWKAVDKLSRRYPQVKDVKIGGSDV